MRRNVLLFILVLVLSLLTAPYLGNWYDKFSFQDGGWSGDRDGAVFLAGMLVSYVLLIPFVFELIGQVNRKKLIGWLLAPVLLFWVSADPKYIYIPVILAFVGFFISWCIRYISSKFRQPNLQIEVKK